mmetsp:Transcript_8088/g.13873  ORF Transcript_8088/g.13873 Transcript_8088/m.13873 type:complete len:365 (-) Transcript_8088:99-1193(-)
MRIFVSIWNTQDIRQMTLTAFLLTARRHTTISISSICSKLQLQLQHNSNSSSNNNSRPQQQELQQLLQQQLEQRQQQLLQSQERIEKRLDDTGTVNKGMSEASRDFTNKLLRDKGVAFKMLPICLDVLDDAFSDRLYKWGDNEQEKDGLPGCQAILQRELLPLKSDGENLGIFDVRSLALPEVHGEKQKSNGYSDLAIGDLATLSLPNTRDFAFGLSVALIELKTAKAPLKNGQLLLQLISFSSISNAEQGVVVLGTDCATKWRLVYFTKFNEITIQQYVCGKKCLDDLSSLIESSAERKRSLVPSSLPSIEETQFPEDAEDPAHSSAYLNAVAHHLAGLFPSEREDLLPMVDENRNPPPMIYL